MSEIEIHEDADEELKAAALFYESRESGLGEDFLQRVSQVFDALINQPFAGQTVVGEIRRRLVRQFPYSIVYRVEDDRIFVLAVAHWRRRPGYWRNRT